MRLTHANFKESKGWYAGPWESDLAISVGFANKGINEPHIHSQITEIYLVVRGTAEIRVEHQTLQLTPGDVLIVDPGEAHTFLASSSDYHHFVIHTPGLSGAVAQAEKSTVSYTHLGLPTPNV